jgi:carbon monoxide dehydrogenase subunit G
MAYMTTAIDIARPVSEVYEYLLQFENMAEWAEDVEYSRKTSDGPVGPGTKFEVGQIMMGRARNGTMELVEVDPERSIKGEAQVGPLALTLNFALEPVEGGTRVTVTGDGQLPGPLKLLAPIGARRGRSIWAARLASLKKALER